MRANRPEKSIQNEPKIVPGRCLGDIRGLPGASRKPVRADFQTQLKIYEKHEGFWEAPGRPGRPPGIQRDPKNRLNFDFFVKKHIVFFIGFSSNFREKSTPNRRKTTNNGFVHKNRQRIHAWNVLFQQKINVQVTFGFPLAPLGRPGTSQEPPRNL